MTASSEIEQLLAEGRHHLLAGRAGEAQVSFQRATTLAPTSPAAWRALGASLRALGRRDEAGATYLHAYQASANDPLIAGAAQAVQTGRLKDAYPILRDRLQAEPDDIGALRIMADLAVRTGRHIDGARLLMRMLDLAPDLTPAAQWLNSALFDAPPDEALAEIESQLARAPDHLALLNLKAGLLNRSGDYEATEMIYRRMLALRPDDFAVWTSLGQVLQTIGRSDEGIAAYRRAIALHPMAGEAWWSLADVKTFRFEAAEIAHLRRLLADATIDSAARTQMAFALGKALEDAGKYPESFELYAEGNRLRHMRIAYHGAQLDDQWQRAARLYTPDFFAQRPASGDPASDPIFVVGLPRSGSTLIEQILASHNQVEGTMELSDLLRIVRQLDLQGGRYPEAIATLPIAQLAGLGAEYLRLTRIQRKTDRPRFVDKLPSNFAHIGLIRTILPNARIIDVRRHPLSCGWSCFKQYFARGHDFSYDQADLGAYYRIYVRFMALWDKALSGHVHRVFYEDIVADAEHEVRRLLDYLDLPFDPDCLRFHENERAVRTPSAGQVRQPIFTAGLDQWRHYEPWLAPLKTALGDALDCYPAVPGSLAG